MIHHNVEVHVACAKTVYIENVSEQGVGQCMHTCVALQQETS
jgi:hypothetical protein